MLGYGAKLSITVGFLGLSLSIPAEWECSTVLMLLGIVASVVLLIHLLDKCPRIGLDVRDVAECRQALEIVNMETAAGDVWGRNKRAQAVDESRRRIELLIEVCRRHDIWCPQGGHIGNLFPAWLSFLNGLESAMRYSGKRGAIMWGKHCSGIEDHYMWSDKSVLSDVKPGQDGGCIHFYAPLYSDTLGANRLYHDIY